MIMHRFFRARYFLTTVLLASTLLSGCNNDLELQSEQAKPEKVATEDAKNKASWREQYAYSMGFAAYQWAFPYMNMARLRYDWTNIPKELDVLPYAPVNHFHHNQRLTDASWRAGGGPNNDALYSLAWVHVDDEPVILSIPASDRYYSFAMSGFDSDNFAYAGTRTTGNGGGHFALLPKGWKGELPDGVTALAEVPYPWFLIIGRTVVLDKSDVSVARTLQKQYLLTPLSYWGKDPSTFPASREVFKPYDAATDPLAAWKNINQALTENPPLEWEKQLLALFAPIQIGPNKDVEKLDEDSKRGLIRAAKDAFEVIKAAQLEGAGENLVRKNGWFYSHAMGRGADYGDYFFRTVHQAYSGIVTHNNEEAMFYGGYVDPDGKPLYGSDSYKIRFAPGEEPEVNAFWSLTLYEEGANFTDNEIDRYSIGDRTAGLKRDADGGLTIYIQHEKPSDDKISNWLPAPEGKFFLWLRTYLPQEKHLKGEWAVPPIQLVSEK
jgi:hypothetical protein